MPKRKLPPILERSHVSRLKHKPNYGIGGNIWLGYRLCFDIRSGDSFKLLYQEKIVEGAKFDRGNIIAATFINQGTNFTAVLMTTRVTTTIQAVGHEKAFTFTT